MTVRSAPQDSEAEAPETWRKCHKQCGRSRVKRKSTAGLSQQDHTKPNSSQNPILTCKEGVHLVCISSFLRVFDSIDTRNVLTPGSPRLVLIEHLFKMMNNRRRQAQVAKYAVKNLV